MADTKISDLTQLTAIDPADRIPIVDTSATATKYILPANLFPAQAANTVFSGPTSGGSATATFRALVAADIPALAASAIASGQLALARGGTGSDLSATGGSGRFLKQTTPGGAVSVAAITTSDLPTTGLTIQSWSAPAATATDGGTTTYDLAASSTWLHTLGGNRTLALSNATASSRFSILLSQDGVGSRSVTWFSGITWVTDGGLAPALTTTPNKRDLFTFLTLSSGVYIGFVAGQNF